MVSEQRKARATGTFQVDKRQMWDCQFVGQLVERVPKSTQKNRKGDCAGEKKISEQTLTSASSNYDHRAKTPAKMSVSLRFLRSVPICASSTSPKTNIWVIGWRTTGPGFGHECRWRSRKRSTLSLVPLSSGLLLVLWCTWTSQDSPWR